MEILIILIIVAILGYVIYQTQPEPKFKKATSLFHSGNIAEAFKIYESIYFKHQDAPAMIAECRYYQGKKAIDSNLKEALHYFNQALEIKKHLPPKSSKERYELIEAKSFIEIAQINYDTLLKEKGSDVKINKLKENLTFISTSTKAGIENEFLALKQKHLCLLAEIYFELGIKFEKSSNFKEAIRYYSSANVYAKDSSNSTVLNSSKTRIEISKLKNNEPIDKGAFDHVNNSSTEYKKDFYFRYVKKLLNEKSYVESERIILKHLNFSSSVIDKLKEVVKTKKINDAIKKVNVINYNLDKLYENSFPVDEVKVFYENLDKNIEEINSAIPSLADKLKQLQPSLFNRLLTHYISETQYGNAIVLIQKFPSFWESPEILKNLGICCYNYVAEGNLSEKNYRAIISNWLTAVYCDKVILKSLEETNWDDEYTFTLIDAIGSNYQHHGALPDNVNYEDISDSNISIGTTQKELLRQFEALLQLNIADTTLAKSVTAFYEIEKEAIEKVVSVIPTEILFAAPYFAKTHEISNEIITELNNDFEQYSNEDALKAGIPYIKDKSDNLVCKYAVAKELIKHLLVAVQSENLSIVQSVVADKNKFLIEKFESIKESVEDAIYNAFHLKIKENDENENLIPLMDECIRFTSLNEKLKYQYSSFVANFCISKVNDDEIDNYKALSLMKNAYFYSKDNEKICKNLVTLIRYNLMDIANDKTNNASSIYQILDTLKSNRSNIFTKNSSELSNARADILSKLKNSGVDISQLIGTYSFSLTSGGEKLKKALTYMSALSEGSENQNLSYK